MEQTPEMQEKESTAHVLEVRREKLNALRAAGQDPYAATFYRRTHTSKQILEGFDGLEGQTVRVAGRMMSRRIMGKASFAHMQDVDGLIQLYVKRDNIGQEAYQAFKGMDIGDIVGAEGKVFRTHAGEISVEVTELLLLSKSLYPLPEKFHGLKDADLRYRQRYVDLIVNPEVRDTFRARSQIMHTIREFLDARGFLEVDTPVLHTLATGAAAKPFRTYLNALDIPMYLRIETELYLKRLIVGGLERVYEIGRIFRNEGMDTRHNPEFTSIELYQAFADYTDMMEIAENMFAACAKAVCGTTVITYQGETLDLTPPWRRMTMAEAVKTYCGIDFDAIQGDEQARAAAKSIGVHVEDNMTHGQALYACFDEKVEQELVQPTFITRYPVEVSPLARRSADNPMFTERFEFFIARRELGNAFSELNDPIDQRARFEEQLEKKMAGDGEGELDEDFLHALEIGMPPTGGMGIGIDRLVMLLTDSASIRDVLLFPTMKNIDK
nr:lysine--tRNA ligase [bacterium]